MGMLHDYLEKNGLSECEISVLFLKLKIKSEQTEKSAAWTLFVELATRIATQDLPDNAGVEKRALDSLYEFFKKSRDILVQQGRMAQNFSVIAVYAMNNILRPFLAKWHRKSEIDKAFDSEQECTDFRNDLKILQKELVALAFCLGEAAGLKPDLTEKLLAKQKI